MIGYEDLRGMLRSDRGRDYNANGAVTNDGVRRYTWDRAGRMATVETLDGGQTLARYDYDDRDWRARSSAGDLARQTLYVRDSAGLVLTEFARPISVNEPHWRKDYVYAVGRHVAVVENIEPSTPVGLRFTTSNPGAQAPYMQLQWDPVADEDVYGYDVYRRNAGSTAEFVRLTSSPVTNPLFVDTSPSVADATAYEYQVSALDWGNVESARTVGRKVKVGDHTPPPVPANLSAQIELCTAFLSWGPVLDADSDMAGYNVYRKTASAPDWPTAPRNGAQPLQQPSFQDDVGLYVPGITLQYRVEALDALGNASLTSVVNAQTQSCMASLFPPRFASTPDAPPPHRFIGDHLDEEVNYRVRYYHVDHLGTPRAITDSAGAIVAKNNLFPFGEPVPPFTSAGNAHWFTGHERDYLSGHDYMLARSLSSASGRFITPDPIVVATPAVSSTWNQFQYARNNPLRYVDPTGETDVTAWREHRDICLARPGGVCSNLTIRDLLYQGYLNIQRYGNYGGERWTGGAFDGNDFSIDSIDAVDEAYKQHDLAYDNCEKNEGGNPLCYLRADQALANALGRITCGQTSVKGCISKGAARQALLLKIFKTRVEILLKCGPHGCPQPHCTGGFCPPQPPFMP